MGEQEKGKNVDFDGISISRWGMFVHGESNPAFSVHCLVLVLVSKPDLRNLDWWKCSLGSHWIVPFWAKESSYGGRRMWIINRLKSEKNHSLGTLESRERLGKIQCIILRIADPSSFSLAEFIWKDSSLSLVVFLFPRGLQDVLAFSSLQGLFPKLYVYHLSILYFWERTDPVPWALSPS